MGWRGKCTFGAPERANQVAWSNHVGTVQLRGAQWPVEPSQEPASPPAGAPTGHPARSPWQRRGNLRPYCGCAVKDVSGRVGLHEGTVRKHIEQSYRAVGVNSRADLSNRFRG